MSKRRLRNSIDEATQTSFSEHEEETHWTGEFFEAMSDRDSVHGSASAEASDEEGNCEFHEDGEVATAREAVNRATATLEAMPANPAVPTGADPTAMLMAQMLHTMQLQNAQSQLHCSMLRQDWMTSFNSKGSSCSWRS